MSDGFNMLKAMSILFMGVMLLTYISPIPAQTTELNEISFSGSIHHALPGTIGSTLISSDDRIVVFSVDDVEVDSTGLSDNLDGVDIDGYQQADACGAELFSVDVFASINGVTVKPADVFMSDGSIFFNASEEGIPANINIDALTRDPNNCDLIFSVDGFIEIDGDVLNEGDLIRWNATAGFSLFSAILSDLPVDAVFLLSNGNLLVSFAETVTVAGSNAQPNDVLELSTVNNAELTFNPVVLNTSWQSVNLDALSVTSVMPGQFVWSVSNIEILETASNFSLTVNRINGSDTAATVAYTTVADSASSGSDFITQSGSIVFNDGQTTSSITISLQDDPDIEGNEEFFVDLTSVVSGTASVGNPSRVRVLLRDDEDFIFADGFE